MHRVKQTVTKTFSLDAHTAAMLAQISKQDNISMSALLREWIISEAAKRKITAERGSDNE